MNIVAAYSLLAPAYDFSRSVWAQWVMGRAEVYLEQELLPHFLTPDTRILDLGSGTGVNPARLQRLKLPFADYTGLDLTPAMLAQAQAKCDGQAPVSYCRGDMRRLPFPAQSFDLILSTWALSHLSPPQPVFNEARRVLKRDGILIVLFWSRPSSPMGLVAGLLGPLFLARFVEQEDLRCLGSQAIIRRFAGGWGTSIVLAPLSGEKL